MINHMNKFSSLLTKSIDEIFLDAREAVEKRDVGVFGDIDLLFDRYLAKSVLSGEYENLLEYRKRMVNFLAWFEWGGEPRWVEVQTIVYKWEILFNYHKLILESKSPAKAYKVLKKTKYGIPFISILIKKKMMKPMEIKDTLNISKQAVSRLLSHFEEVGLISRDSDGKNVWVSIGTQGVSVYHEYRKEFDDVDEAKNSVSEIVTKSLKLYDKGELAAAFEILESATVANPDNSLLAFMLGVVAMVSGDSRTARESLAKSVRLHSDKDNMIFIYLFLDKAKKLKSFKDKMEELITQTDDVSPGVILWYEYNKYLEKTERAICIGKEFVQPRLLVA